MGLVPGEDTLQEYDENGTVASSGTGPVVFDKRSFVSGVLTGRQLKGWDNAGAGAGGGGGKGTLNITLNGVYDVFKYQYVNVCVAEVDTFPLPYSCVFIPEIYDELICSGYIQEENRPENRNLPFALSTVSDLEVLEADYVQEANQPEQVALQFAAGRIDSEIISFSKESLVAT